MKNHFTRDGLVRALELIKKAISEKLTPVWMTSNWGRLDGTKRLERLLEDKRILTKAGADPKKIQAYDAWITETSADITQLAMIRMRTRTSGPPRARRRSA